MLVNDNIFGFETYLEYQEFIKLLIEIRTPKLSKDGFKPSIITEIMSNSLRGLSDEDLKAVSESIENMNKTKEQLEMLHISQKALKQIITPYENYNKCILYNKAKKYDEKQKLYKKIQKESNEITCKITTSQKQYEDAKIKKQEIVTKIDVYKYKEKELRSSELWEQKERQREIEKQIEEIGTELKDKEKIEDDKNTSIRRKEIEEKETKEKHEIEKDNFDKVQNEMEQIAKQIDYDEFFFKKEEISLEQRYNYKSFKEDIKRYIKKIEDGKKALEKEQLVSDEYEIALQNLDKEKEEKTKQDNQTNKSRNKLEQAKEKFTEDMYVWERQNTLLKIQTTDMAKIAQKVESYGDVAQYDDIILQLHKPYSQKNEEILNQKAVLSSKKDAIEKDIDSLNEELKQWKNQKEPEPEISEKIQQNRKKLKEKQIPYIEFYNAVDFKKDLNEKQKGRIEAALLDMGILNALIIPKEYTQNIKQIDQDFVDKYLIEQPIEFKHDLTEFLEVKLPQDTKIKTQTVFNILKSIMIEEKQSNTYINEDGEYKIGILLGIADNEEKAKYIGSEARRQYKQKQIEILENQIFDLNDEKEQLSSKILNLEEKLQVLKTEYERFPNKEELEQAYNELKVDINKVVAISENIKKLEDILTKKLEKLKQAKDETLCLTKNLRFPLTLDVYEENLSLANNLKEYIFDMEKYHNNVINEYEKLESIEENLENLRYDLDQILYEKGKLKVKLQTLQGKLEAINQMNDGMEELEKQMEEVLEKLETLPKENENLAGEIAKLEEKINQSKENQIAIEQKLKSLENQLKIAQDIFKQELNLKYVIEEYEDFEKVTNEVLSQYSYFDKETKSKEDYRAILIEKYRDSNDKLLDYNLSINQIFVQEIATQDSEQINLEQTRTRSDIICFVNGRKVDLNALKNYLEETIEETQNLVAQEDRNLFEEILIGAVGRKIRQRIYFAKNWVESMNSLMKSLNTSSGLSFSLNWKPKLATTEEELDTKQIVEILNSDSGLLKQEDIKKVATHFRTKFKMAEKEFSDKGAVIPFYSIIKDTLDYRKWFEFQFMYKKADEQSKELTNNAFFKLSGGEKAMAMYMPLFASVCARYQSARKDCLRIISLDEAFAGVDDNNIKDMFRILTQLELEYVINSQVLWGEYDTVPSLSICELVSDVNNKVVSVMRYHWNGKKRELTL